MPIFVVLVLWLIWAVSWIAAALWSARTQDAPKLGSQLPYRALSILGGILMFGFLRAPRFHVPHALAWLLVAAALAGFLFTWWARIHLGKLWSSSVTKKVDHRVVDTGPYAIVRHPIYTGLIAAVLATAVLRGTILGFVGGFLMILGFWIKARLEERFLREQLGEAYDTYRRRVPMLLPFGPKSA